MTQPLFSVVVPTFNRGALLLAAVESCISQFSETLPGEVIVVDDASETTEADLTGIENVTVVRLPQNAGPLQACLEGLRNARGRFVVTLDSDDTLASGALQALACSGLLDDRTLIKLRTVRTKSPEAFARKDARSGLSLYMPGRWFTALQMTGGPGLVIPRGLFNTADQQWPDVRVQDHVLPGLLALHAQKVISLRWPIYLQRQHDEPGRMSTRHYRMDRDRLVTDRFLYDAMRVHGSAVRLTMKLAIGLRTWRYARRHQISHPESRTVSLWSQLADDSRASIEAHLLAENLLALDPA